MALAGSMCYLELGLLVRKTGGEYAILLEAYSFRKKNRWVEMLGSLVSFLYTWTNVLLLRGVAVSIIMMTCARYFTRPFFIGCEVPEAAVKLIALAILLCSNQWAPFGQSIVSSLLKNRLHYRELQFYISNEGWEWAYRPGRLTLSLYSKPGIKYNQHITSHLRAVIFILVNIYGIKLTVQVTMLFSGLKLLAIVFIVAVSVITVGVCQSVPERLHQPFQHAGMS